MTDNRYVQGGEHIVQRTVQVPVERVVHEQVNPVVAQAVEPSHWSKWWWLPLLLLAALSSILWHGCRTHDVIANTTVTVHQTLHETVTHQAAAPAVEGEQVTIEHLTLNTEEENHIRDGIHGIVPDIERDGAEVVNGAKHVCAAVLNGAAHGAADLAGFFHLGGGILNDTHAGQIVDLVGGAGWCHR